MFNRLKAHLFPGAGAGGAATGTTASTPPSTTRPRHIPNLYPVGDTTVETYFRRLLAGAVDATDGVDLADRVREDVVAAAIHVARTDGHCVVPEANKFLPVLTRCVTADYDGVLFANLYMTEPEEAGVSALAMPLLLQILVAVALKHRNKDLLRDLLERHGSNRPQPTLFETVGSDAFRRSTRGDAVLDDPHYGRPAWALLAEAGWAPPLEGDDNASLPVGTVGSEEARLAIAAAAARSHSDPEDALAVLDDWLARGLDPQPFTGWLLDALVRDGTPAMLAHFLGVVTRKVYDGVPPRPKWPGMQSLVTMAAARPSTSTSTSSAAGTASGSATRVASNETASVSEDSKTASASEARNDGYGVLRVLVDIGGMDIHTSPGTWYKKGPDDEHPMALSRSTQLPDGSCADDPPLLAAVHAGNRASVLFLLQRGVAERRAGVLDEAIERAKAQQNAEMVSLLEGWRKDSEE